MHEAGEMVVVANRLPVRRDEDRGTWVTSPGGLVSALAPILRERGGSWVGWTGAAEDAPSPFEHEGMNLCPVRLTQDEIESHYLGFCNDTLWPLYHNAIRTPAYHRRWWGPYREVNERFARLTADVVAHGGTVWVHDYQLQLVPGRLRERRPDLRIGHFLHIPFPPVELFAYLPWRRQVLEGLLGADVLAFQTKHGARNFRAAAVRYAGAEATADGVSFDGRSVRLQVAPISIDTAAFQEAACSDAVAASVDRLRDSIGPSRRLILGVDRLDYTKGIDHRLRAVETFHERYPELAAETVLLQVAVPSREEVPQYVEQRERIEGLVGRINGAFGRPGYTPVVYMYRSLTFEELVAAYRAADVMLVTPLADGMNLVAKEYVASRTDDDGVLMLSEFAGAAAELEDAILVNPLDLNGLAEQLRQALSLPAEEAGRRMSALRRAVGGHNVYQWARECLEPLTS